MFGVECDWQIKKVEKRVLGLSFGRELVQITSAWSRQNTVVWKASKEGNPRQ